MERWKDVKGYGMYQVSNYGNVKRKTTGREIKPYRKRDGYLVVTLCNNHVRKYERVHRLVALHFLEKGDNTVVHHIDNNPINNHVDNLEWTTISGNTKRAFNDNKTFRKQVLDNAKRGTETMKKPVLVLKDGTYIGEYDSNVSCAKALNISVGTVYNGLKNNYGSRTGYTFYYIDKGGDASAL